ncbi:MAG: EI24 domain-containing protein [Bacteroidales bacterium]|nr:EI24 domain-containing protein [Bacteroidales bacterium]
MSSSGRLTFFDGLKAVFKSIGAVGGTVGLWVYFVILGICLLFLFGSFSLSGFLSTQVKGAVMTWLSDLAANVDWLPEFVLTVASGLSAVVIWLVVMCLMCLVGGAIILILLSPLLSIVSDKMWAAAGHAIPRDSFMSVVKSVGRGVMVSLLYAFCQVCSLILIFILSFIPVVGVVAPVLSIMVYAFFYGASFSDYALERSGRSAGQALNYAVANKSLFVGIGLPFTLLMFIPIIGSYLALFIAPATAAAGASLIEDKNLPQKQ